MLILYVHKYVSSNLRQQNNMEVHQQFLQQVLLQLLITIFNQVELGRLL